MSSIKKRGKSWRARADLGFDPETGGRRVVSATGRTKKEACDALSQKLEEHRRGEYVPSSKLTVGQWLDTWLEVVFAPDKRPRTIETYRSVITHHLKPGLGATRHQALEA